MSRCADGPLKGGFWVVAAEELLGSVVVAQPAPYLHEAMRDAALTVPATESSQTIALSHARHSHRISSWLSSCEMSVPGYRSLAVDLSHELACAVGCLIQRQPATRFAHDAMACAERVEFTHVKAATILFHALPASPIALCRDPPSGLRYDGPGASPLTSWLPLPLMRQPPATTDSDSAQASLPYELVGACLSSRNHVPTGRRHTTVAAAWQPLSRLTLQDRVELRLMHATCTACMGRSLCSHPVMPLTSSSWFEGLCLGSQFISCRFDIGIEVSLPHLGLPLSPWRIDLCCQCHLYFRTTVSLSQNHRQQRPGQLSDALLPMPNVMNRAMS